MLSSPPPRFAASTRLLAERSRSSRRSSRISRMASSVTIAVRPSEQIMNRSPGSAGMQKTSTSTSGSVPRARVMTERCGWISASSGESLPLRTSSATKEWSSVSCSSLPSRTRYARESPTWPIQTAVSSTRATVMVVPIPETASSSLDRSYTRRLASWISCTTRSLPFPLSSPPRCRSAAAASREAISPACAPPMPSATAKSGCSRTKASSFCRRLRPGSVIAAV